MVKYYKHSIGSYDGAFFALTFYRNTKQEAKKAWKQKKFLLAYKLFRQYMFWWNEFIIRRGRARIERL